MYKTFNSPKEFSQFLRTNKRFKLANQEKAIEAGLAVMAKFLQEAAKSKFGHYQDGWEELSLATKKERIAKGFTANDPLLRTGDLKDSVKFTVIKNKAVVGSTSEIMVYQEKGTSRTGWTGARGIPPRPVFLITQMRDGKAAVKVFAKTFFNNLRDK